MFLERDVWEEYLQPGKLDQAGQEHMLELLTAESDRVAGNIASYEVDRKVNYTTRVDPSDASLIEPL